MAQRNAAREQKGDSFGESAALGRLEVAGPRAVIRGMEVIRALTKYPRGGRLVDLSDELRLPKTSLLNLLRALVAFDYVEAIDGRYHLGLEALRLASLIRSAGTFPANVRPVMEWLERETSETIVLGVMSESQLLAVFADVVESEQSLRLSVAPGGTVPLHCSAVGHALLAAAPQQVRDSYFKQRTWAKITESSPTKAQFRHELGLVEQTGFATSVSQHTEGVMAIAKAVFDRSGELRCAVSVGGPIKRIEAIDAEIRSLLVRAVSKMADLI